MNKQLNLPHYSNRQSDFERYSFHKLISLVISMEYAYEDLAEIIEDKGYEECVEGKSNAVIEELKRLSQFFETMHSKNEENVRDLADVYLLIGEFYQCSRQYFESIGWYKKAIIVDDTYDIPYHSLSQSYLHMGKTEEAIKCLEQEIIVAPGNYYSYLALTELYEKRKNFDKFELILKNLLIRDPNNIRALHRLITFYQKTNPNLDIRFLRRKLIRADQLSINHDLMIWTYHMCQEKKYDESIRYLNSLEQDTSGISITHLLKAYIYGLKRQYVKKRRELKEFVILNHGREEWIRTKLDEFSQVFGEKIKDNFLYKVMLITQTSVS